MIGVLAGCASTAAYGGDILAVQYLYYHVRSLGFASGGLLTQQLHSKTWGTLGAFCSSSARKCLASASRASPISSSSDVRDSYLIAPPRTLTRFAATAMVWPSSLVVITLYNTLHNSGSGAEQALTRQRLRFFSIVFLAIFAYQFLPAVVMSTLTSIALLCIMNNHSVATRMLGSACPSSSSRGEGIMLTGGLADRGAGLLSFSLDWSVIGSAAPLYTPFFASCSFYAGLAWAMWVLVPWFWFTDTWNVSTLGRLRGHTDRLGPTGAPVRCRCSIVDALQPELHALQRVGRRQPRLHPRCGQVRLRRRLARFQS